jgi:hypothetical protein
VPKASSAPSEVDTPEVSTPVPGPSTSNVPSHSTSNITDLAAEMMYRIEAERGLDEEEEVFNTEADIADVPGRATSYNWEDKYRPRKPRYFNRVHTGYEWNKYNQTHYEYVSVSICSDVLDINLDS